MARKECRCCGRDVGKVEHVELRVLDWEVERIPRGVFSHHRRKSHSMASLVFCPTCAIEIMDRVYQGVES